MEYTGSAFLLHLILENISALFLPEDEMTVQLQQEDQGTASATCCSMLCSGSR
jgi:hypothetical protein